MIVAIDAGNSRIKWGVFDHAEWVVQGVLPTIDAAGISEAAQATSRDAHADRVCPKLLASTPTRSKTGCGTRMPICRLFAWPARRSTGVARSERSDGVFRATTVHTKRDANRLMVVRWLRAKRSKASNTSAGT